MGILQIILLSIVAYVVLLGVAIHFYGIWGFFGFLVFSYLLFRVLKRLAGTLLQKLFMQPFKVKGRVLKDAEVRVLAVTSAPAPQQEHVIESGAASADGDTPEPARDWYYLDVTITPTKSPGPMVLWEPGELLLVGPEATPELTDDATILGEVHSVQVWQDGAWQADEVGKYEGPQRLKLHVGVQPDSYHLRFRYYLEVFGHIEIPSLQSLLWQESESV